MKKWKKGGFYGNLKIEVLDADGQMIAAVRTKRLKEGRKFPVPEDGLEVWPEGEANLALIIAAPDLLATLENIAELTDFMPPASPWEGLRMIGERTRAAIAKAKGG